MRTLPALLLATALTVTACGSSSSSSDNTPDPTKVAKAMKATFPAFTKVITITEDNDGNNLLGRPNGYDAAAVAYIGEAMDSCDTEDPVGGVDCGAVIERWPSERKAEAREDYIQGILENAPMLGQEYDTVEGRLILRVGGDVKPSDAAEYKKAFLAAVR